MSISEMASNGEQDEMVVVGIARHGRRHLHLTEALVS